MKPLISDPFWEHVQPLLPPRPQRRFRFPGRKPLDERKVLTGIAFVLKTGIAWDDLPAELGCGCGKTCRNRLQAWHRAGVWCTLHALLLAELNAGDAIDWSRALIDASFVKAPEGGENTGPNPTDRAQVRQQTSRDDRRTRHPSFCDGHGGERQRSHSGLTGFAEYASRGRQARAQATETRTPPGRSRLRLSAVTEDPSLAGNRPGSGCPAYETRFGPGSLSVVRGANNLLAPRLRPPATTP